MSRAAHPLAWIPPFAVGVSAAVAGELAVGLLLYVTPGFLRALTLILAVLLGSLALGLWTAPHAADETLTESLRRRWLLALVAFAGGAAVSGAWSVQGGLAAEAFSRGVGLALLAALPLYACGALLGAMSSASAAARPADVAPSARATLSETTAAGGAGSAVGGAVGGGGGGQRAWVGASAAAGAALGTILSGYVLISLLLPVSVYAFCLVLLSGGALLHGWVIAAEGERSVTAATPSAFGEVRVEEWSWGKARPRQRILSENGRVRGAEDPRGWPARRWEAAALDLLGWESEAAASGRPGDGVRQGDAALDARGARGAAAPVTRLSAQPPSGEEAAGAPGGGGPEVEAPLEDFLFLGGGALTLPRQILARIPGCRLEVVERNGAVLRAAALHFGAPREGPRLRLYEENLLEALARRRGPYRAIVVDGAAVAPHDPVPMLGGKALGRLRACLGKGGIALIGGLDAARVSGPAHDRFLEEAGAAFPLVALYAAGPDERRKRGGDRAGSALLAVLSPDRDAPLPRAAGGMTLDLVHRAEPAAPSGATGRAGRGGAAPSGRAEVSPSSSGVIPSSPGVSPSSPDAASASPDAASASPDAASASPDVTSASPDVTSAPPDVTSPSHDSRDLRRRS